MFGIKLATTRALAAKAKAGIIARALKENEGQSAVEFALVLPTLLIVVTGITTFGVAMNNYLQLTHAASVAARTISLDRGQTLDPCAATVTAVTAAAPLLVPGSITYSLLIDGHTYAGTSCVSTSMTTGAPSYLVQGTTAQVTLTYPCTLKIYNKTLVSSCTLTSQVAEYIQ